jgi:Type I restriction-modification system methyltransferase subunit
VARVKYAGAVNDRGKEFLKLFDQLTYSRSAWQVWEDLVTVMACSICNAVDRRKGPFERREEQYERSIKNLGGVDIPAQMFGIVTMALEEDPHQDLLGQLYMSLNLGSHWHGQFFTPYHVSELMAKMSIGEGCKREIAEKGYASVCDPCVGAGAMLIASAQAFRECGVDYQTDVLFVGQDIDPVVAKMAYIQLSLLGCPGYIIVGDSLLDPPTGHVLFPEDGEGREVWITPMFMHQIWEMRRAVVLMQRLSRGTMATEKTAEKERYFMFFGFDREEAGYEEGGKPTVTRGTETDGA